MSNLKSNLMHRPQNPWVLPFNTPNLPLEASRKNRGLLVIALVDAMGSGKSSKTGLNVHLHAVAVHKLFKEFVSNQRTAVFPVKATPS